MNSEKNMDERRSVVRALGASLRWTRMAFSVVVALAAMTQANAATIGEAVDATNLVWTTGGDTNWFYQTTVTTDGIDAAQSGAIGDNQATWIQTTVTGPGTVSFWWKVSTEPLLSTDSLKFYVDDNELSNIYGETGWSQQTTLISNGTHTLKWQYSKNNNFYYGSDCGWLDQVVWAPVPYYEISVSEYPVLAGSVVGSGSYLSNAICTVMAAPSTGYTFSNWTEGAVSVSTSNSYTFTVSGPRVLVANFTLISYTVATSSNPTDGGTTSGGGTKAYNSLCTVTAVANTGYSFTNWTEGTTVLTSSTNYTDSVLSNRMLVANFTTNSYMITTSPNPAGGGTITGDGSYPYHSSCILIATPKPNYTFANWTEGASIVSTSPNYGFQVDGPRTLVANFTPDNFEIVTSSNPMGGGTTSGGGTHAYDSSCTLIAVPAVGYIFTAWTEGPSTVSTSTNYTFTVSGDRTLVANFTKISYTITTSSNPVGGGTIAGAGPYEYGASCTVIATPSSSWYTFVNWTEGTNEVSSTTNYMFTVESNRTLVANFVYTRTIGHAVDAPELIWSTGGEAGYPAAGTTNWFAQTATTHDGVDAAQSGTISDGGTSWMQTTVIGPGSLSFWWKVDTLDTGDKLKFFVDSIEQPGTIGGQVDWNQKTHFIPAGTHTLRWAYSKNFNGSFAPDCGWVDQVVWEPTYKPDLIIQSISHSPVDPQPGDFVTFTVTIQNQGTAATEGVFNTAFWSDRATAPMIGTVPEQTQDYASTPIAPGATRTLTFQVPAPAVGTYKAWAYVDRFGGVGHIKESDEANNAGPSNGDPWSVQLVAPLYNTVPIYNIAANTNANPTREYMITVPLGEELLNLTISGGIGNCDLYVRHGARATTSTYDYRPYLGGNDETVSVILPMAGSWYILLDARADFEGVALVGNYSNGGNAVNDFDGDSRSDIAVFHPETGNWYVQYSRVTNAPQAEQFGWNAVVPVPADYDGDGIVDIAVYYPDEGMWYILESLTGLMRTVQWGWADAAPVPGDYDGDGKADIAVFHQATGNWYIQYSTTSNTPVAEQFGWFEVVPVPADYDGDGITDIAVYYPDAGMWYIRESSAPAPMRQVQWGWGEAVPVPGDYDGDGKADIAVFHRATGNWYIQYSILNNDPVAEQFGWWEVVPVPADYDGDGKTDIAVYYAPTGTWYIRESTSPEQMRQVSWGWSAAIPTLLTTVIHDWFGLP